MPAFGFERRHLLHGGELTANSSAQGKRLPLAECLRTVERENKFAGQNQLGLTNSGSSMSSTSRTTPSPENWTHRTRFSP